MSGVIDNAALLRAFSCLERFPAALLAVSGGPDSMALMHLSRRWLTLTGRPPSSISVATVDHGLRAESKDEAAFVAGRAALLGFTHTTLAWTGEKPATGIQAAARAERYDLLIQCACEQNAGCVVTAHTEDDQAETLLMRLRRGSGIDGLAAMSARSEREGVAILRPLLGFSKNRLTAYLRSVSAPFLRDPSNNNGAFERVRLRHAAKAFAAAGVRQPALALTARRAARSRDALNAITDAFLARHFRVTPLAQGSLSREAFAALPADIALRALGRILPLIAGVEASPRLARLERLLEDLERAPKDATLGGCIIAPDATTLTIHREPGRLRAKPVSFASGSSSVWDGRFILTFATGEHIGCSVRPLGAAGWRCYAAAMKQRRAPIKANRLAALTIPALWRDNQLFSAPLLNFCVTQDDAHCVSPLNVALHPRLARFLPPDSEGTVCALGKDKPIPYL